MNLKEIRSSSSEELRQLVISYKRQLFAIRFKAAGGDTSAANKSGEIKKTIARILTVLNQRQNEKSGGK